jgi:outer membrane immunogenic protein
MKKMFWGALLAVGLVAGPAVAADMAVKARPMPPAPVVVYTWTGCYIGVSGGGAWVHKRWDDIDQFSRFRGLTRADHTATGGMGGGQVGCDYQTGRFVFGIEGSYHAVDATVRTPDNQAGAFFTNESHVSGLGQITGRVGYTVLDQALLYVRGGVAFERDRYTIFSVTSGNPFAVANQDRTGGTVGFGLEYLFTPNFSAFIEYDYYDFGSRDVSYYSPTSGNLLQINSIRERKDVLKVGLNYRFNWAQPVVAKY